MQEIKKFLGKLKIPHRTPIAPETKIPQFDQYEWEKTFVRTAKQGLETVFALERGKTYRLHKHCRNQEGEVVEEGTEDFMAAAVVEPTENLRLKRDCILDAVRKNPNTNQGEDPYLAAQYNTAEFGRRMFTGTWQSYTEAGIHNYTLPLLEMADPRWANWVEEIGDKPQTETPKSE